MVKIALSWRDLLQNVANGVFCTFYKRNILMKTRRKNIKSPVKGRRSSVISSKICPVVRRSTRLHVLTTRNTSKSNKVKTRLKPYESPLASLRQNSNNEIPSTSRTSKIKQKKTSNTPTDDDKGKRKNINISIVDLSSSLNASKISSLQEESRNISEDNDFSDLSTNLDISNTSVECKKRKKRILNPLHNPKKVKRKVKKSPLSKPKEKSELDKQSDSIIFEDDEKSQTVVIKSEPVARSNTRNKIVIVDKSLKKTLFTKPVEPSLTSKSDTKSQDIVVIDSNESLLEMEAYHNAFNQSMESLENSEVKDSIIVIDADDEPPVERKTNTTTSNEDCFVVWSSLPQPCTSSNSSNVRQDSLQASSWSNNNSLFSSNKIFLDTRADLRNLKYLNNENNKPLGKRITKSPKVQKAVKRSSLKTYLNAVKSSTKVTGKAKTATKVTEKNKNSVLKKKVNKKSDELIFLSESTDDLSKKNQSKKGKLREIVVDGNNIGMAHTNNKTFSERGVKLIIDYFTKKGHSVKVFIPQYRRSRHFPLLEKWNADGIVVFTPSRKLGNKSYTPYDDRYIIEYATACNGIVVSQDQFRDLYAENPEYRDTIENRLLVPTFVGDYVMFPVDPLGRNGPTLTEFLKH